MGTANFAINPTWGPLYGKAEAINGSGSTGYLTHPCNGLFILAGSDVTIFDCDGDDWTFTTAQDIVLPFRATRVDVTTGTVLVMW